MKINIKNEHVGETINFLFDLPLKGKQSRHRTRFINLLTEKHKQIVEEELQLIKEFAGVDENGEPKRNEHGNFDVKDVKEFKKQQEELLSEEYVVEGGDYHGMLKTVKEIVLNYDEEVSGKKAVIYDYLCEAFEDMKSE